MEKKDTLFNWMERTDYHNGHRDRLCRGRQSTLCSQQGNTDCRKFPAESEKIQNYHEKNIKTAKTEQRDEELTVKKRQVKNLECG